MLYWQTVRVVCFTDMPEKDKKKIFGFNAKEDEETILDKETVSRMTIRAIKQGVTMDRMPMPYINKKAFMEQYMKNFIP